MTLLLAKKKIPAQDYIHLYDSTLSSISKGYVAAKLPCNDESETDLQILIGQAPNLQPAELELVPELSTPGKLCIYHVEWTRINLHSPI